MNVESSTIDNITVIEAAGSIDSKTAGEFERVALAAIQNQSQVLLDLTKVEFLSSAGLRVLLMIYRQVKAKGGKVALVGTSEEIQDVMENTGFWDFFLATETRAEGVEALKAA